jgi:hypothetical protein
MLMPNEIYSDDELFVRRLQKLQALLNSSGIEYCFVGSCAIQSYLEFPRRLPNDADILIDSKSIASIVAFLQNLDIPCELLDDRVKFRFDLKYFDLITTSYTIYSRLDNSIIGRLNLDACMSARKSRPLQPVFSNEVVICPVIDSGHCLFLEMSRPLNTNSFFSVIELMNTSNVDLKRNLLDGFLELLNANSQFAGWILRTLSRFELALQSKGLLHSHGRSLELLYAVGDLVRKHK